MLKFYLIFIVFVALRGCGILYHPGIEVQVVNQTDQSIRNVIANTSEDVHTAQWPSIESGATVSQKLSMLDNYNDGNYSLQFKTEDGQEKFIGAGYYTNGAPLHEWVKFTVRADTILVDFPDIKF